MPRSFASPSSYNVKGYAGVCCITTYVSKRKKELTFRGGWYVLEENYIMKIQVKVPTPKIRTHVSYVSKRNFLPNTPQLQCYFVILWLSRHTAACSLSLLSKSVVPPFLCSPHHYALHALRRAAAELTFLDPHLNNTCMHKT